CLEFHHHGLQRRGGTVMELLYSSEAAYDCRVRTVTDRAFALSAAADDTIIVPGESNELVEQDRVYDEFLSATVDRGWQIVAGELGEAFEYESLNESIATVNELGKVERVSDGTVGILVHGGHTTQRLDLTGGPGGA